MILFQISKKTNINHNIKLLNHSIIGVICSICIIIDGDQWSCSKSILNLTYFLYKGINNIYFSYLTLLGSAKYYSESQNQILIKIEGLNLQ